MICHAWLFAIIHNTKEKDYFNDFPARHNQERKEKQLKEIVCFWQDMAIRICGSYNTTPFARIDFGQLSIPPFGRLLRLLGYSFN